MNTLTLLRRLVGCLGITLLAFLAIVGFCESAAAAVIYSQDFSTVSSGWGIGTTAPGTISFAAGSPTGAPFPTRSLELSHVANSTTRLTSTMPGGQYSVAKTSTLSTTFQFDLRLSQTTDSGFVTFLDSSNNSQLPMFINVTSAGNFVVGYWNGSANTTLTLLSGYSANTTYTFTFTTVPSTGLFSASVTGGTASLVDQAFRRTSGGLDIFQNFNSMQVYNDGGGASASPFDMYVDNILIQNVPEPSVTAGLMIGGIALIARRVTLRRKK